jgi:hypothetical protein
MLLLCYLYYYSTKSALRWCFKIGWIKFFICSHSFFKSYCINLNVFTDFISYFNFGLKLRICYSNHSSNKWNRYFASFQVSINITLFLIHQIPYLSIPLCTSLDFHNELSHHLTYSWKIRYSSQFFC